MEKSTSKRNRKKKEKEKKIVPLQRDATMIEAMEKAKINIGLTPSQALQIIRPTDPKFIRKRPGKGGKTFKYVPIRYFEMKLISVFGWNWRFEIVWERITDTEIVKRGRLWFKLPNGEWNFVERSGGASKRENVEDFNREKAAESDAFKRCCIALGFFADVYAPAMAMEDAAIAEGTEVTENHIEEGMVKGEDPGGDRIEEYEANGKKYIRIFHSDGTIETGIDPDQWIPMHKVSARRAFAGKGYSSNWKKQPSAKQIEVIKKALEKVGIDPKNAVFKLNNRADRKVREKRLEQLDYGDAWDITETIIRKGKNAFLELVEEIVEVD